MPLSHYYNERQTPDEEFGRFFFYDWDETEWAKYDQYMRDNIRIYLQSLSGGALRTPAAVQSILKAKKLQDSVLPSVLEWLETFNEGQGFAHGVDYLKKDLFESYRTHCGGKAVTPRKLWVELRKFKKYSEEYIEDVVTSGEWGQEQKKSRGRTIFFLRKEKSDKVGWKKEAEG